MLTLEQHCRVEAAHSLPWHEGGTGKCANKHGHSYEIQVVIDYDIDVPPSLDFMIDFGTIKKVVEQYDHCDLNEHPEFNGRSTTVENFCYVVHRELKHLAQDSHKITVRIQEGRGLHWATYSK